MRLPSPERWSILSRQTISRGGVPFLFRLRLIRTPLFGVYIHDITGPDPDAFPHDHPYPFISIVLRGGYTERLWPRPALGIDDRHSYDRRWLPWSVHRMDTEAAHRILRAAPDTRTLVLAGPRKRTWGFWQETGWTSWHQYLGVTQ